MKTSDFNPAYQPPLFTENDRYRKVMAALPELDKLFQAHAEENHFPGYVYGLVLDDTLIWSGSSGVINLQSGEAVTTASLFRIASMSKSFTAMAILRLRDAGKLQLSDPASRYVPQLAGLVPLTEDAPPLSIHHLLSMSGGLPEDNPWGDRHLDMSDTAFAAFLQDGLTFSNVPGYGYEYSNLGYAILGRIISEVSGRPYQDYIRDEILLPLGMEDTHWEYEGLPADQLALGYRWEDEQWKPEPMLHDGAFGAMGGLITSLDDFSKYVAFHLSAWPPRHGPENGPLKRSSLREMHQMHSLRSLSTTETDEGACAVVTGYGYGLRVEENCRGLRQVSHAGGLPGFGSEYRFFPELGIGLISFANRTYAPASRANNKAMDKLMELADPQARQLPVSAILAQRKEQVIELLRSWDETLGEEILAVNFYPDISRAHRQKQAQDVFAQAGPITSVGPLIPENQLRGTFDMYGEEGTIRVFFSLSPEKEPKVQALRLWLVEK